MTTRTFIVIVLLMTGLPICLYVRHHRMKDLDVKFGLFSGFKIHCSFFKD
nr:MAG TPA: hypothetical protein [Caudoviricetes sp.]